MYIAGEITEETADLLSQDGCVVPDVIPDPHFMKRLKRQLFVMRCKYNYTFYCNTAVEKFYSAKLGVVSPPPCFAIL